MKSQHQFDKTNHKTRFSILTNIKERPRPQSHFKISSLVTIVMLIICILIIISKMIAAIQKSTSLQTFSTQNEYSKTSSQKFEIIIVNNVQKDYGLPPIPSIEQKIVKCQKTKKQQLQQSIKNIEIFQLMKDIKVGSQILEKYFTKIQPIYVVKHEKFTSTHFNSEKSLFSIDFWNPFSKNFNEKYEGVDKIFYSFNQQKWRSLGKYLTVVSDYPIKPTLIYLILPEESIFQKTLHIFGISVVAQSLVNQNTLQSTLIKKTTVTNGYNKIQCDDPMCVQNYSMIMLVMQPMQVIRLEIYSSFLQTWINFSQHS